MRNLIKMDLRRMFKTPLLYALLLGLGVMVGTFGFTGIMGANESIAGLIGPVDKVGDMMSTMGISLTLIFGAVYAVSTIGKDFSTGFIKNILTVHADKKIYILSKIVVATIASTIMIFFYFVLMFAIGLMLGLPFGSVSIGGVLLFLVGKVYLAIALNALCIGFMVTFRNLPISIIACFVFGMGALTMLLNMLASSLNIPVLSTIANFTIAGTNSISVIEITNSGLLHLMITVVVWLLGATVLGCSIMKKKDV